MTRISSGLLSNTLNVVQLARETALQMGKQTQASQLSTVVDNLRSVVNTSRESKAQTKPTGILAQDDFRAMMAASQASSSRQVNAAPRMADNVSAVSTDTAQSVSSASSSDSARSSQTTSALERNRIIVAMSGGNMSDLDIARQMGMTREEVRMVLNINQHSRMTTEG
jgi:DNA-binding CsgD family transcriptional regulator